jgi:type IV pilus assembly protein PilA
MSRISLTTSTRHSRSGAADAGALFRSALRGGHGMTMVEVLVVVGILAILALLAVPGLQEKIVRDQVVAAVPLADIAKPPIAAAWASKQSFPGDNAAAGLPVPDKIVNNYIRSLTVADGAIHLTFGNSANGLLKDKVLTIRPAVVEDAPIVPVAWICGNARWPDKMTVKGENRTNLPSALLPVNCRAG